MHTSALPTGASAPLSAVLATEEFLQRPTRAPDYEAESRALAALAQELSNSPTCILQKLVEASLDLCRAHSSGISLLDEQDGERIFRWPAIAGVWAPHVGGTTPRDFSPCGVVLDRNSMQLFVRSDRYYSYFGAMTRPAYEALLIPFSVGGEAVGTVWVVSHDESRHFDLEDYRLLSSVGKFASAAFGLLASVEGRKQPDAELRQSEERARLALEVAQLGTWSWEPDTDIVHADSRCRTICGLLPLAPLTWSNIAPRIHPEDRARVQAALVAALCPEGAGRYSEEFRFVDDSGAWRWVATNAKTIFASGPHSTRAALMHGTVLDVTLRKQAEEALKESDRRKDEFLATLAHELRNPLAPLRNGLHVLRMANITSKTIDQARDVMERQVGHMVRLIDDLLDVTRIRSGKIMLRRERIEIATVIQSAVETSLPLIQAAGHQLAVDMPSESPCVFADEARLTQVFSNLINNAAKFTRRGGHIAVTARQISGKVIVTVKDSGIGIAPQVLPRVFEMFMQADRSGPQARGGLGLGLHIVQRLVAVHGGSVEARSEGLGLGSEFVVTLPAALSLVKPARASLEAKEPARMAPQRVLVVDDSQDVADSTASLLQLMGNDARTAYGGAAALELARLYLPDAILLDIAMPDLDGYESAQRIRGEPWGANVTLIAMTGYGRPEDHQRSLDAGFDHHIVKPVDPAALERVLAEAVQRRVSARVG
jgi:PAS domain S-box-containing protein